eukprot:1186961-Prorocentrum_minimum.AAC.6
MTSTCWLNCATTVMRVAPCLWSGADSCTAGFSTSTSTLTSSSAHLPSSSRACYYSLLLSPHLARRPVTKRQASVATGATRERFGGQLTLRTSKRVAFAAPGELAGNKVARLPPPELGGGGLRRAGHLHRVQHKAVGAAAVPHGQAGPVGVGVRRLVVSGAGVGLHRLPSAPDGLELHHHIRLLHARRRQKENTRRAFRREWGT